MRHALYDELRMLTDNPHVIAAIETAAITDTPETFRAGLYRATSVMPEIPKGNRFSKDCFWAKFQEKFIWHTAFGTHPAKKNRAAEWLQEQRESAQRRGHAWPPKPVFMPVSTTPQPWDGRNEKPGNVPRDGKS